ncbi:MAG: AMP-binding protein, partial [Deltaproteobacteria bacterium]|nr:AMP-binding protein [Deltaproteobacteria bacterium]
AQRLLEIPVEADPFALGNRLELLCARHEILRTALVHEGVARSRLAALPTRQLPLTYTSLIGFSAADRDERVREFRRAVPRPDTARDPLFRVDVFQAEPGRALVLLSYLDELFDQFTISALAGELLSPRPPLGAPRPFSEFLSLLEGRERGLDREYWGTALKGARTVSSLFVPAAGDEDRELEAPVPFELDAQVYRRLRTLSRDSRIPFPTLAECAFAAALSLFNGGKVQIYARLAPVRDMLAGALQNTMGCLLALAPARCELSGQKTFLECAGALDRFHADSAPHSFAPLREARAGAGGLDMGDLVFFAEEEARFTQGSLQIREMLLPRPKRDLAELVFHLEWGERRARATIHASPKRFRRSMILDFRDGFTGALAALAAAPRARLSDVGLLSRALKDRALEYASGRGGAGAAGGGVSVAAGGERARAPDRAATGFGADGPAEPDAEEPDADGADADGTGGAVPHDPPDPGDLAIAADPSVTALEDGGMAWTRADLDRAVLEGARFLAEKAALARETGGGTSSGAGYRAALLFPYGPMLAAAALAALKAGCAAVPLDPFLPDERLAFIVADSQADAILSSGALMARAEEMSKASASERGLSPQGRAPVWDFEAVLLGALGPGRPALEVPANVAAGGERVAAGDVAGGATEVPGASEGRTDDAVDGWGRAEGGLSRLAAILYCARPTPGRPWTREELESGGIALSAEGCLERMRISREAFGLGPGSRALAVTGSPAERLFADIVPALRSGGTVTGLKLREHAGRDPWAPEELGAFIRDRAVSFAWLPAPAAKQLLGRRDLGSLKTLALSGPSAGTLYPGRDGLRVVYAYGAVGFPALWRVCSEEASAPGGRPAPGVEALILDGKGGLLAPGAVGGIRLSGEAVGRPAGERAAGTLFFQHPFRRGAPEVLKTPDAGFWDEEGCLNVLGPETGARPAVRGRAFSPEALERRIFPQSILKAMRAGLWAGDGPPEVTLWLMAGFREEDAEGRARRLERLRRTFSRSLPAWLIPTRLALVDRLPLENGLPALDRLPAPDPPPAGDRALEGDPLYLAASEAVSSAWRSLMDGDPGQGRSFAAAGLDGDLAFLMAKNLRARGFPAETADLRAFPTPEALAAEMARRVNASFGGLAPAESPVDLPDRLDGAYEDLGEIAVEAVDEDEVGAADAEGGKAASAAAASPAPRDAEDGRPPEAVYGVPLKSAEEDPRIADPGVPRNAEPGVKAASLASGDAVKAASLASGDAVKAASLASGDAGKAAALTSGEAIRAAAAATGEAVKAAAAASGEAARAAASATGEAVRAAASASGEAARAAAATKTDGWGARTADLTGIVSVAEAETETEDGDYELDISRVVPADESQDLPPDVVITPLDEAFDVSVFEVAASTPEESREGGEGRGTFAGLGSGQTTDGGNPDLSDQPEQPSRLAAPEKVAPGEPPPENAEDLPDSVSLSVFDVFDAVAMSVGTVGRIVRKAAVRPDVSAEEVSDVSAEVVPDAPDEEVPGAPAEDVPDAPEAMPEASSGAESPDNSETPAKAETLARAASPETLTKAEPIDKFEKAEPPAPEAKESAAEGDPEAETRKISPVSKGAPQAPGPVPYLAAQAMVAASVDTAGDVTADAEDAPGAAGPRFVKARPLAFASAFKKGAERVSAPDAEPSPSPPADATSTSASDAGSSPSAPADASSMSWSDAESSPSASVEATSMSAPAAPALRAVDEEAVLERAKARALSALSEFVDPAKVESLERLSPFRQALVAQACVQAGHLGLVGIRSWTLEAPLAPDALEEAFAGIVKAQPRLRSVFTPAPGPMRAALKEIPRAFSASDLKPLGKGASEAAGEAAMQVALSLWGGPGAPSLHRGPLLRLMCFRLDEGVYRLTLVYALPLLSPPEAADLLRAVAVRAAGGRAEFRCWDDPPAPRSAGPEVGSQESLHPAFRGLAGLGPSRSAPDPEGFGFSGDWASLRKWLSDWKGRPFPLKVPDGQAAGGSESPLLEVDLGLDAKLEQAVLKAASRHSVSVKCFVAAAWLMYLALYFDEPRAGTGLIDGARGPGNGPPRLEPDGVDGSAAGAAGEDRARAAPRGQAGRGPAAGVPVMMPLAMEFPNGATVSYAVKSCAERLSVLGGAALNGAFPGWGKVMKTLAMEGPAQSYFSSALVFDQRGAPPAADGFRTRAWEGAVYPGPSLTLHVETAPPVGTWRPAKAPGITGRVAVDRALLGADLAYAVRAGFLSVLAQAAEGPGRKIGELTLLAAGDDARIRKLSRGAELPALPKESLGFQIRRRLEETGGAMALSSPDGRLDGRGLLARAREIAEFSGGMGPGLMGAILMPMGADFVCAALSLVMSGAACAPLDPQWQRLRLKGALRDADPDLLMLSQAANPLAEEHQAPRLVFREGGRLSPLPGLRPSRAPLAAGTAAVLYSGESGPSLGAVLDHQALAARARQLRDAWKLASRDKCALLTGCSAPEALPVVCAALLSGAELCLPPAWARDSGAAFLDYAGREGVTVAFVPALLSRGIQSGEAPKSLRACVAVGGRVSFYRPQPYAFWGDWGPRETFAAGLRRRMERQETVHPLGWPSPGMDASIVSRSGALRPLGMCGEIALSGPFVARGYLNRPEESAGSFMPDPRAPASPEPRMLFRTGLRGEADADGNILPKGRMGEIVNVLGLEPELQEIEKAVKVYPGVFDARVMPFTDAKGLLFTEAYVVRRGAAAFTASHARPAAPSFSAGETVWLEPEPLPLAPGEDEAGFELLDMPDLADADSPGSPADPPGKDGGPVGGKDGGPVWGNDGGAPPGSPDRVDVVMDSGKDGGPAPGGNGSGGSAVAPALGHAGGGPPGLSGPVQDDDALFTRKLEAHLRAVLPPAVAPRNVTCIPAFPLTDAGRLDFSRLPRPWQDGLFAARARTPGTLGEYFVLREMAEFWPGTETGLGDRFSDLGGDSLAAAEFSWALRDRLGLAPSPREVLNSATFRDLARTLEGMLAEKGGELLSLRKGRGPALVLAPVAASGVLPYRDIMEALPDSVPVLALNPYEDFQRSHRGAREAELMGIWAEASANTLAAALPRGGFVLLAAGFKGALAWEAARRLKESHGLSPRALVFLDALAPPPEGGPFPVPGPAALRKALDSLYYYEGTAPERREASPESLLFELRAWWVTPLVPVSTPVLSVRSSKGLPDGHLPVPWAPAPLQALSQAGFREMILEGDTPSLFSGKGAVAVARALEAVLG